MPQQRLKIPHATTKTQCSQINRSFFFKEVASGVLWEGKEELENIGVSVTSWVSISLIQQQWCFQGEYLDLLRDITGLSFLSPMPSRNTKAEMALD